MKVAIVHHGDKTGSDDLDTLRRALADEGLEDAAWYQADNGSGPKPARQALHDGAEVVFVWGGDGTLRHCLSVLAGSDAALAVLPAGTGNLFAANFDIPTDIEAAVRVGLHGDRRMVDVGSFDDESFAVMAGVGFDAEVMRAPEGLKRRAGRAAYFYSGARSLRSEPFNAHIETDGTDWYEGPASCVLLGNLGDLFGGLRVFPDAAPDDGMLELGVVTADGAVQWLRTLARTVAGDPTESPFVQATRAKQVKVTLDREVRYELDGDEGERITSFQADIEPGVLRLCVPHQTEE